LKLADSGDSTQDGSFYDSASIILLTATEEIEPMLKNDRWITEQAQQGMIEPFEPTLVRSVSADGNGTLRKVLSFGLSFN
jgi:hypothetical protein